MNSHEPQSFRPTTSDDETSETFRPHRGTITPLPDGVGEGKFGQQHLYNDDDLDNAGDDELRDRQPGQEQRD